MNTSIRSTLRTVWVAVRAMAVLTVVLGVGYPLVVTGIGQLTMPGRADGSILRAADGRPAGSALIGQSFTDADGRPLARYFQARPSAAGQGYDAGSSSGSNLGPTNPRLSAAIAQRRQQVARFNGVSPDRVPPDAVTASGSGLDPDISTAYADIQIPRVARARGLPVSRVSAIVRQCTGGRTLGILGEPTVDVLEVNLALDRLEG